MVFCIPFSLGQKTSLSLKSYLTLRQIVGVERKQEFLPKFLSTFFFSVLQLGFFLNNSELPFCYHSTPFFFSSLFTWILYPIIEPPTFTEYDLGFPIWVIKGAHVDHHSLPTSLILGKPFFNEFHFSKNDFLLHHSYPSLIYHQNLSSNPLSSQ